MCKYYLPSFYLLDAVGPRLVNTYILSLVFYDFTKHNLSVLLSIARAITLRLHFIGTTKSSSSKAMAAKYYVASIVTFYFVLFLSYDSVSANNYFVDLNPPAVC